LDYGYVWRSGCAYIIVERARHLTKCRNAVDDLERLLTSYAVSCVRVQPQSYTIDNILGSAATPVFCFFFHLTTSRERGRTGPRHALLDGRHLRRDTETALPLASPSWMASFTLSVDVRKST